jgi:hypothetical protein
MSRATRHAGGRKMNLAVMVSMLAMGLPHHAAGQDHASELSELSMLPIALSVAAPVALLSVGAVFTVVSVGVLSEGTVWVLERASDGARFSVRFAGDIVGAASVVAGATVGVLVISTGCVLTAAGKAIAFIPNELGRALLYNERLSR